MTLKQIIEIEKPSEQLFGIPRQPNELCPKIDAVVVEVQGTVKDINYYLSGNTSLEDYEKAMSEIDTLNSWLDVSQDMDEIRNQVILIREWGQHWKNLAKELFDKYGNEEDDTVQDSF